MLGLWPVKRTGITFQNHHFIAMTIIEFCHLSNSTPILLVAVFIVLKHLPYPLQQQFLWWSLCFWQLLYSIKNNCRQPMLRSYFLD